MTRTNLSTPARLRVIERIRRFIDEGLRKGGV
jgi:hypothetical protein